MAQVEFNVPGPGTYLIEADPSLPPLAQPGTAADMLTGEQFYDEEGNPITGTMPNNPAESVVIPGGGSYTIPQGYHTGQGTVTSSGSVLPTLTDPASAGEIVSGKEVIDQNGSVLTGTMPSNPAISETLEAGESYQVPAGYTPGGTVQVASLASQTPSTATQDDIIQGQTAWVNGVQITGVLEPGSDTSDATATASQILAPYTAYVASGKVTGTMPSQGAQVITPGTTQQTINGGVYLTGTQTISGDANLVPNNIKENVSIFGVTGAYGGGGSTGDFAVPLTVTVDSGATVTAVNGDTTLTTTSVDRTANFILPNGGAWTVTANLDGRIGQSVVSVESTYTTTVTLPSAIQVFGVSWDMSNPSTKLTRLTSATDPNGYVTVDITEDPSPAIGTGAGSSPFDSYMPWSGMKQYNIIDGEVEYSQDDSQFSRAEYDTLVYIPLFYYKIMDVDGVRYFYISSGQPEGFDLHPGSNVYIARYNTISGYFSKSNSAPLTGVTLGNVRTSARAKGTGWGSYDYMSHCAILLLYLVEFADWDSQTVIGAGSGDLGDASTGVTDAMIYHTGRIESGDFVQYRWIEAVWNQMMTYTDGLNFDATVAYICTNPEEYSSSITNYVNTGVQISDSGFISGLAMVEEYPWVLLPSSLSGSDSTYIPDNWLGIGPSDFRVSAAGGGIQLQCGMFSFTSAQWPNNAYRFNGSRLMFRGLPPT